MYLNLGNIISFQYNASHLLPLNDQQIVSEASSRLIKCVRDFEEATVIQQLVRRSPRSAMHFLPGKLRYYLIVMYVPEGKILVSVCWDNQVMSNHNNYLWCLDGHYPITVHIFWVNQQLVIHWCCVWLHNQVSYAWSLLVHMIYLLLRLNYLLNIYLSLWTKPLPAGSYKHTVRGTTSVPNLFIAGDWIVNRHGSFSKVRGLYVRKCSYSLEIVLTGIFCLC